MTYCLQNTFIDPNEMRRKESSVGEMPCTARLVGSFLLPSLESTLGLSLGISRNRGVDGDATTIAGL